jgi:formamidopyrimidine-DNA glycosylase
MPELPEVETIVRCLRRRLIGLQVEAVRLIFPPIVRNRKSFSLQRFKGRRVTGLRRRGKLVLLDFSGGLTMIIHLKMTGQLLVCPSFLDRLAGRRGRLKSLLLNQRVIAGIGNIYADEILFESGLDPRNEVSRLRRRRLESLWSAVPKILNEAIAFKGTTVRDYRDGEGLEGLFQNRLKVYGREGEPCPRCGTFIQRIRVSGRSTHFCPSCQRR